MDEVNTQIISRKTVVQQAIDYLREYVLGIDDGAIKLPSENEIAAKLGISRLTIREALTVLENEGLIVKNQGSSTTVTTFARKLAENIDYKGELGSFIEDCGAKLGIDVLGHKEIVSDEIISKKLDLKIGEEMFHVEKLFLADYTPAAMCINRVPKKYVQKWDFKYEDLGSSMFDLIEAKTNFIFSYDVMEIIPETVTEELSNILRLEVNSPILRVDVVKYSMEGIPIMYNSEYYVDDLIRFTALRNNSGLRLGMGSKSIDGKGE